MPAAIPKAELVAALEALAADLGRPPTRAEMESQGEYSATPYYRQFGSWPSALEQACLEPQYRQDISDDELRTALRDLAAECDRLPRQQDMAERGPFSPSTYRRRFGSWRDALAAADLEMEDVEPPTQIERKELVQELYRLTRELGRPPTQTDMKTKGLYSPDVYHDRFGSWSDALAETGLQLK